MYGKGLLKGLSVTTRHFFKKNITQMYPEERPNLADRFRGSIELTESKCIVCGLCANACPNNVIKIVSDRDENKKRYLVSYELDMQYCLYCGLCVESCPTDAINFNKEFENSRYLRKDIALKLYQRTTEKNAQSTGKE